MPAVTPLSSADWASTPAGAPTEEGAPLRIAFFNHSGEIGGAERSLLLLLSNLDRRKFEPSMVLPSAGRLTRELDRLQVGYHLAPFGRAAGVSRHAGVVELAAAASGTLQLALRLSGWLRKQRFDCIHTNGMKSHFLGGLCGALSGLPVIWHVRDLMPEGRARILLRVTGSCVPRRIIAISQAVAEQFRGSRAADRVRVIHNAVDPDDFRPSRAAAEVRRELGVRDGEVLLAMVAHFTPWKGHLLFLEIVSDLLRLGFPVRGVVVGSTIYNTEGHDGYEGQVRVRHRELELGDRVVLAGYQDRVADYLQASDILVHPPLRPEPFGRVLIEAMALSRPVVAAAAGGALEILTAADGLLVPPGERSAFVDAVAGLVRDRQRAERMGAAGRTRALEHFTREMHVSRIQSIYLDTARKQ